MANNDTFWINFTLSNSFNVFYFAAAQTFTIFSACYFYRMAARTIYVVGSTYCVLVRTLSAKTNKYRLDYLAFTLSKRCWYVPSNYVFREIFLRLTHFLIEKLTLIN